MDNALNEKLDLSALHLGIISVGALLGAVVTLVVCILAVRIITVLLRRVLDQLKTGFRDGVSYEDLYQRLLYGVDCPADQYLLLADFASYCAASHRVVDTYADREKWNRMSLHNIARSGIFSADRSIADYADTIWHVPYKK